MILFVHYTAVLGRGRVFRLANRRVKICGVEGISISIPSSSLIKKNKKQFHFKNYLQQPDRYHACYLPVYKAPRPLFLPPASCFIFIPMLNCFSSSCSRFEIVGSPFVVGEGTTPGPAPRSRRNLAFRSSPPVSAEAFQVVVSVV